MKKILLVSMLSIGIFLFAAACVANVPPQQSADASQPPEYQFERNDLIMIIPFNGSGANLLYFENGEKTVVYNADIWIRFDKNVEIPVVKAKFVNRYVNMYGIKYGYVHTYREIWGVEMIFRDKEQIREYWQYR